MLLCCFFLLVPTFHLSYHLCFLDFSSVFPIKFPVWVDPFSSWFSQEMLLFHRLVSNLHRLDYFGMWCYLSGYLFISRFFFFRFCFDCFLVLVSKRRQCGFLLRHNSLHNLHIHFFLLVLVFVPLCFRAWCLGCYYFAFTFC